MFIALFKKCIILLNIEYWKVLKQFSVSEKWVLLLEKVQTLFSAHGRNRTLQLCLI